MLKHGGSGKSYLDFSVNINPIMTQEKMTGLLIKHSEKALIYPPISGGPLRASLADKMGIGEEELVVGNGATELIYGLANVYKNLVDGLILLVPTFTEYERAFLAHGLPVIKIPIDPWVRFTDQASGVLANIRAKRRHLVILCNPNNPTGTYYEQSFIEDLLKVLEEKEGHLLIDTSFMAFERKQPLVPGSQDRLVCLSSLTKYYGIPGLRLGYAWGSRRVLEAYKKQAMPWAVNHLAHQVMLDLLEDSAFHEATSRWYLEARQHMVTGLLNLKAFDYIESHANFLYVRHQYRPASLFEGSEVFKQQGIYIRSLEDMGNHLSPHDFRIGLRTLEEQTILLEALGQVERGI